MSFLSEPFTLIPIRPVRKIGEINVQVVVSENTTDTLTITKQPVQQGASITDHAYMEPTGFSTAMYFKDNLSTSLSKIYQDLLDLQSSRVPFDIITPKRIYHNMLMSSLSQTTDKSTENVLKIDAAFQAIVIVSVVATSVARSQQRNPGATGATEPAGKKSFLRSTKEAVGGLLSP